MIKKERIEYIKTTVDLKALVENKGIHLKRNGNGWFGLCPFHNDTNPSLSINPSTNLWQCFGCGKGGDAIRFVELFDHVDFKEAVKRLSSGDRPTVKPAGKPPGGPKKPSARKKPLSVREKKLLARVAAYYQHTFTEDPAGRDYLQNERGIKKHQSLTDFGVGYVNGTLLSILPEDEDIIQSLKRIGILNAKGKEVFYKCVVFPLCDENGTIVSLYGRNTDPDCEVNHLYLSGPRCGLVNRQAAKRSQTLILTESIIDALTLYDQGFKNVMPVYGTNGLTDDHLLFFNRKIRTAYIVFDADEAGRKAAETVRGQLNAKEIAAHGVALPDKDVNIYFKRHTPEEFEQLLKHVDPDSLERSESVEKREQTLYKETGQGFIVGYGERQYHVKGIQRSQTQLKVTVKAGVDVEGNKPFELTTIDLYSSRSRHWFAKLCADLFGAAEALVKEDIGRLLPLVEGYTPGDKTNETPKPSAEDIRQAMAFLNSSRLMEEIQCDLVIMGVIGEQINKIVCYLAATSRKLAKPLSVLIQSRSSAGKSTLQNAILALMPDEDFEKYTRVTDQSLFYKEEDSLVHKILAIDESAAMTAAIHQKQRESRTLEGLRQKKITERIIRKHQTAQRLLKPIAVVNDFTPYLTYPCTSLVTRRDHEKYLGLIETVAFLHQHQRKTQTMEIDGETVEYIDVTLADIDQANRIADAVLGQSLDELARPSRTLLEGTYKMVTDMAGKSGVSLGDVYFTRRMIREYMGWSDWQIKAHIKQLEELEYLHVRMGSRGKEYAYALNYTGQGKDRDRFYLNLTTVEQIQKRMGLRDTTPAQVDQEKETIK